MRFLLKYYYLLDNPIISRNNNSIYVKVNGKKYLFTEIENVEEFNAIVYLLETTDLNKVFYKVIKNTQNSFYVIYQQKPYALIEINDNRASLSSVVRNIKHKEIDYIPTKYQHLNRSNWYFLWIKKNDYFSNINHHSDNTFVNVQLDYYIGLAETAIQYLNEIQKKSPTQEKIYLTYKRINENTISNPIYLVLDKKERDISEYIKYLYFNNEFTEDKMSYILEIIVSENLNLELIYARVLYPTYFFDTYEKEESKRTKKLTSIEIFQYEVFLRKIYSSLSKIKTIKKVDWL